MIEDIKKRDIKVEQFTLKVAHAIGDLIMHEGKDLTLVEQAAAVGQASNTFIMVASKHIANEEKKKTVKDKKNETKH